jgi:hypothetical protein
MQKTTIVLEDDIHGGPAAETIRFSVNGVDYEIDLNETNARYFYKALAPYQDAGHTVKPANGKSHAPRDRKRANAIRAWAATQGYELTPRGRTPDRIVRAYEAVH